MKLQNSLFAVLLIIPFAACYAQSADPSLEHLIKEKGDTALARYELPGIFIGVLDKGKRSYYSFGYADPVNKTTFDSATLFEAGSITKTFTAYIVLSVLKEKVVGENMPIVNYLPDSVKANPDLQHITFLKLLNHTSGLPRLPTNIDLTSMQPYKNYSARDLFSYLKTAKVRKDGKSEYSNLGFGLAATLVSLITNKSYAALLDEYIFFPFKMLKPADSIEATDKKSKGFMGKDPVEYWQFDALAGAGALKCTADEMLTYLSLIANPKNQQTKTIVNKLLDPSDSLRSDLKIGRAWIISTTRNKPPIYWHNGGTYGFSTFAAFLKGQQKAVIVVINKFNANAVADQMGMGIMDKLRD
jgi:CubicO group peptidase (beta-lactamase class C family)